MEILLSLLRITTFILTAVCLVTSHSLLAAAVFSYIFVMIISYSFYRFFSKKYRNIRYPFISRIWRMDVCYPMNKIFRSWGRKVQWTEPSTDPREASRPKWKVYLGGILIFTLFGVVVLAVMVVLKDLIQ